MADNIFKISFHLFVTIWATKSPKFERDARLQNILNEHISLQYNKICDSCLIVQCEKLKSPTHRLQPLLCLIWDT